MKKDSSIVIYNVSHADMMFEFNEMDKNNESKMQKTMYFAKPTFSRYDAISQNIYNQIKDTLSPVNLIRTQTKQGNFITTGIKLGLSQNLAHHNL